MPLTSTRSIGIRFLIIGILMVMVYPFLPAKQKWQIQAAFGDRTADSLLNEYYEAPVDGALQFSMERDFAIFAGDKRVADVNDIRYVEISQRVWDTGRVWSIHLRRDAVERLSKMLRANPDMSLWAVLDGSHVVRYDTPIGEFGSPIVIDPGIFGYGDDFVYEPFEPWYSRPFMLGSPQRLSEIRSGAAL